MKKRGCTENKATFKICVQTCLFLYIPSNHGDLQKVKANNAMSDLLNHHCTHKHE